MKVESAEIHSESPSDETYRHVIPYYQPIIQLDTQNIFGYEVLGRALNIKTGSVKTLGGLFHSASASPTQLSYMIDIDYRIQESAIARLKDSRKKTQLFINVMPRLLSRVHQNDILEKRNFHIINLVEKYDIEPSSIVIEVTEDEFLGDVSRLIGIMEIYKQAGFLVAIDDVGSGMSDLSRIAHIHPDIIKVDLQLLRNSLNHVGFRQVLQGVSYMSYRLGSSLLFEGIEKDEELTMAMKMGARYLQGFLFSEARGEFQDKTKFSQYLRSVMDEFSRFRLAEIIQGYQNRDGMVSAFAKIAEMIDRAGANVNACMLEILKDLPEETRKIVVYDEFGDQISSTFEKEQGQNWSRDDSTITHNISWRPFFHHVIAAKEHTGQIFHLTEPYHDLRHQFPSVTMSYVLGDNRVMVAEVEWKS